MSTEKTCFKCGGTKAIDEFYRHPRMADGRLNKCKACTKSDVSNNYAGKREQYASYYKERQQRPERKRQCYENTRRMRERHPEKYKARQAVSAALRTGKLQRQPCLVCGSSEKLEAHHNDYDKPLDVEWYCGQHHRMTHGKHA